MKDDRKKKASERDEARNRGTLSARARIALVVSTFTVYALAYLPLRTQAGIAAGMLAIVPVALAGWTLGLRGGLLAGLIVTPLHTILMNLDGSPGWDVILRETNGLGLMAAIAIGAAIGHWSDMVKTLGQQISQRKQGDEALQEARSFLQLVVDTFPSMIFVVDGQGRAVFVNQFTAEYYGTTPGELISKSTQEVHYQKTEAEEFVSDDQEVIRTRRKIIKEELNTAPNGEQHWFYTVKVPLLRPDGTVEVLGISTDITERKRAEEKLRASEERYRVLAQNTTDVIWTMDMNLRSTYTSPSVKRLRGYDVEDAMAQPLEEALTPASLEAVLRIFEEELAIEKMPVKDLFRSRTLELEVIRKDSSTVWVESTITFLRDSEGKPIEILGVNRDITGRKQAEQTVRDSQARLASIIDSAMDAIISLDTHQRIILYNAAAEQMFRCPATEAIGQPLDRFIPERFREAHHEHIRKFGQTNQTSRSMGTLRPLTCLRADGDEFPAEISISQIDMAGVRIYTAILRDVTERKRAEELIQRQLKRLSALRMIDIAISSSSDLQIVLDIVLQQALSQLDVDAGAVLLFNPHLQTIEYAARRGFRSPDIQHTKLRLGEGYAGRAVLERRTIHVPALMEAGGKVTAAVQSANEEFVDYYGTPLVAKGEIKGVLEIYHRSSLKSDPEWLDFLETLAGQAAIALDNAQLFNSLQRSNIDLIMAYDATIVGWSRAMDLRDKETEGHTQRVTELTLRLAEMMGLSEAEQAHIRRGALLHDMGKLAVPDSILFKPTQLTDEEWKEMRQHPQFAYDMLSQIDYLKPAMDIPYCHHEKWNGSGYPRGLKGEDIPLAARIFAVVDVWDAITSDRPYRKGWSNEEALAYITEQSGKYFDPQVVKEFFRLISENQQQI